jgi:hypothetical protein
MSGFIPPSPYLTHQPSRPIQVNRPDGRQDIKSSTVTSQWKKSSHSAQQAMRRGGRG